MSSSGSRAKKKMTFLIDHILQPDFGSACGSSSSQTLMIEEATKNSKNTQLSNTTEPDAGHMVMGHLRSKSYTTETKDDIFITAAGSSTRSQMKFTKGEKTEKHSTSGYLFSALSTLKGTGNRLSMYKTKAKMVKQNDNINKDNHILRSSVPFFFLYLLSSESLSPWVPSSALLSSNMLFELESPLVSSDLTNWKKKMFSISISRIFFFSKKDKLSSHPNNLELLPTK